MPARRAQPCPQPHPPRPGPAAVPTHSGPGTQGTRMIKVTAGCCGYTVRTTAKLLAEGNPQRPHGTPMTSA